MVYSSRTTILPGSGRPTGCLEGSICRCGARRDEANNAPYFRSNIEPNNAANNYWSNVLNNVAENARYSRGFKLRLS
ncbi:hypothetical protein FJY68_07525 [candidate division WOR-3 bacterium]|uniref:Uncharacterized protein n=1 Tax=candidate division WOR-3 bacterium TaxID=2052148 RepID=A0A937XEG8_UNCW3|nr:hypothetical protein [candidate division WOR-3 bacterium]